MVPSPRSSCVRCGASYGVESVDALFDEEGIARCHDCRGLVKPDVVLFGELLPEAAMAAAQELAERADLMLCVGSSLVVHPVASLPALTLDRGGRLAIVTKGPTPYDGDAGCEVGGRGRPRARRPCRGARLTMAAAEELIAARRSRLRQRRPAAGYRVGLDEGRARSLRASRPVVHPCSQARAGRHVSRDRRRHPRAPPRATGTGRGADRGAQRAGRGRARAWGGGDGRRP